MSKKATESAITLDSLCAGMMIAKRFNSSLSLKCFGLRGAKKMKRNCQESKNTKSRAINKINPVMTQKTISIASIIKRESPEVHPGDLYQYIRSVVDDGKLEVGLRMLADRADLGGVFPDDDVPAVAAFPDHDVIRDEDHAAFDFL